MSKQHFKFVQDGSLNVLEGLVAEHKQAIATVALKGDTADETQYNVGVRDGKFEALDNLIQDIMFKANEND